MAPVLIGVLAGTLVLISSPARAQNPAPTPESPLPSATQPLPVAPAGQALLREEAVLKFPGDPLAVALSADETLLAGAVAGEGATVRVLVFDRPSGAPLGLVETTVGRSPLLRFSPTEELLLVAGETAVELWEVPIAPLNPARALPASHRRWRTETGSGALTGASLTPQNKAYWARGKEVYVRETAASSDSTLKPFFSAESPLGGLETLGGSNTLALWRGGEKELLLVEGRNGSLRQTLSGHRFPVRALLPGAEGALLSLDEGNSLLNWNGKAQITGNFFVDQAPKGFQAGALFGVGRGHLLAVGQPGGGLLLSAKDGTLLGRLAEAEPGRTAVSPTGRYLLTGVAGVLRLYGFARAVSPLDYVRYLRALGGDKIAQSYARLLDERNLPPRAKADLLTEANREPAARRLQTALARLALAQEQKDAAEIRQWAKQVLALQPENPTALAALRTAQEEEYQALLTQAREHLKTGQFRQAITLLDNAIPPASPLAAEAAALIREAENQRGVLTALEQARDKMERGDLTAAEAIVKEVLRQNEEHPAALSLADEIHGRAGGSGRDLFAVITGGVLALLGMGWFMRRQKTPRKPLPSGVRPELKPGSDRLGATAAASRRMAPEGNGSPQRPAPGSLGAARPRPAADASRQTRRKVATELAAKTEEMIRLARQADTRRQYTSLLMELEAELSSLHRRLHDPATDPGPLHIRLKEMVAHLRTLDFREPERADSAPVKEEPSYYEVLQVEPQAGADQIKTAYHRLLKQYHPDLHNQSTFTWVKEEAERMSRRLSEAYEVLINADKRRKYDQELKKRQGGTT